MHRKNRFETYKEAPARGPYDEMPMLEPGIDPQLHLSRNNVPQPFFLICEHDTVIAQLSGEARIEFRDSAVNYFDADLGDYIYVPGGTPHRIVPKSESIHLRYKAEKPGLEAVAWYSDKTGEEINRVTWNCAEELSQEAYLRACTDFNAHKKMRTCPTTGSLLQEIDLSPFRWAEAARELKAAEAEEMDRAQKKGVAIDRGERGRPLVIKRPTNAQKVPRIENVYLRARVETSMLTPIFPYFDPGAIVPCMALHDPQNQGEAGYFYHQNTQQEVILWIGIRGSRFAVTGMASHGGLIHPVGDKPGQPHDQNSDAIYLMVITQRQAVKDSEKQSEAIILNCEKCETEVFRRDFSVHEFPDPLPGKVTPQLVGMPTISHAHACADDYNRSEAIRTCKKCGHINPTFPTRYWGWEDYRRRTQVVAEARVLTEEAAAAALKRPAAAAAE